MSNIKSKDKIKKTDLSAEKSFKIQAGPFDVRYIVAIPGLLIGIVSLILQNTDIIPKSYSILIIIISLSLIVLSFIFSKSSNLYKASIACVVAIVLGEIVILGYVFYCKMQDRIVFDCDSLQIEDNYSYVTGKFLSVYPNEIEKYDIKLFVHPENDTMYYFNIDDSNIRKNIGSRWGIECRFGDENKETHQNRFPIKFEVFAVAVPSDSVQSYQLNKNVVARSTSSFLQLIRKPEVIISDKMLIERILPECSAPEFRLSSTTCTVNSVTLLHRGAPITRGQSPVTLSWDEATPLNLTVWHKAKIVLSDSAISSPFLLNLNTSSEAYHIQINRGKGRVYTSVWFLCQK